MSMAESQIKKDGSFYMYNRTKEGNSYLFGRTKSRQTKLLTEKSANVPHIINILDKISKTIFLSQLLQFELLNCTKLISQENTVQKRASFELFLEETLKKVDFLNVRLAEI